MGVGGGELFNVRKQLRHGEGVESGVDFADLFLGGGGGFFFDDGLNIGAAGVLPDDAAIAGWMVEVGAEQGHGGLLVLMEVQQAGGAFGRGLRSVPGENDYVVVGGEWRTGDDQSVSSAALLGLQYEVDPSVGEGGADAIGLVADDDENVGWRNDARCGGDYVSQQRFPADFMEHLWKLRFQAGAFSGGHDRDGYAGCRGCRRRNCLSGFRHFSN